MIPIWFLYHQRHIIRQRYTIHPLRTSNPVLVFHPKLLVFRRKILCDAKPKPVSRKFWLNRGSLIGGDKLPNANCEHQTTKWKSPNLPTTDDWFWGGGGVNYQTQIVNTKLPKENLQTYQVQMTNSGGDYQIQIVDTKLPIVIPSTTNTISHVKLKKWSHNLHLVIYSPPPRTNHL